MLAGDYLVYKFPTWSWADASPPSKRVSYLPAGKQFLITRGVPCHRRLDENFAGDAGQDEAMVQDGFAAGEGRGAGGDDDGWLRTGTLAASQVARMKDVRTVDESGEVGEKEVDRDDEEEIPDMEDEEDDEEAIIRDPRGNGGVAYAGTISLLTFLATHIQSALSSPPYLTLFGYTADKKSMHRPLRTYTLYITYTPYYRTPRLYLSGYLSPSEPLPPHLMMEDIVGDYADKTVTLEDFPFFEHGVKMASVHPCKHASVMKVLLGRADAALKIRLTKLKTQGRTGRRSDGKVESGMEGLVDRMDEMKVGGEGSHERETEGKIPPPVVSGPGGDEWEVLPHEGGGVPPNAAHDGEEDQVAIRVDQYLVVFLKFMASVTPGIEHDFTMGV